jgi:hypothetical protein
VKSESALVQLPVATNDSQSTTDVQEEAADRLAEILARGVPLKRMYGPAEVRIGGTRRLPEGPATAARQDEIGG